MARKREREEERDEMSAMRTGVDGCEWQGHKYQPALQKDDRMSCRNKKKQEKVQIDGSVGGGSGGGGAQVHFLPMSDTCQPLICCHSQQAGAVTPNCCFSYSCCRRGVVSMARREGGCTSSEG